jgi:hypothetical protein
MPAAEFLRGPHDGLLLDINDLVHYCHLVRTQGDEDPRYFAMMPTLVEWKHILRGRMDKDGPFDRLYPYEMELREDRPVFLFRSHDEFAEAVERR